MRVRQIGLRLWTTARQCPGRWICGAWAGGLLNTPYSVKWAGSTYFYDSVARVIRKWKPYGGLIYFHVMLESLVMTGRLIEEHGTHLYIA